MANLHVGSIYLNPAGLQLSVRFGARTAFATVVLLVNVQTRPVLKTIRSYTLVLKLIRPLHYKCCNIIKIFQIKLFFN